MARRIQRNELQFLKKELQFLEGENVLSSSKTEEILGYYEEKENLSFTKTLLYVGSILVGAGILSFIASNWQDIGKMVKFLLIIALYIGSVFTAYKIEEGYPKTSRSLYYLGVAIFGAGIFLVGQMFHFGGDFQDSFLWWALGILPLALVLRDNRILLAAAVFVQIYMMNGTFLGGETIPYWLLLWIAAIYIMNNRIGFSRLTGFMNGIVILTFLGIVLSNLLPKQGDYQYLYGLVYLAIGVYLVLTGSKRREGTLLLGYLVLGGAGLLLSFQDAWPVDWLYIPFSIVYLLFVFYLIKKGSLLSIIILCVLIFRFYLDLSFAYLPKSFVFILGGLLLLGFGFYFEKQRKKAGGVKHE